ncbi:MAG TPA: hypothetical protein VFC14_02290 [Burkholderiales bacterium]|nr:hypothetical protein [Burkholderiales bacterium]
MDPAVWYELRLEGSAGTSRGHAEGATEAIAIAESGRLCSIASGEARKFATEQEASEYLLKTTLPGHYRFEVVLCGYRAAA